ncbi:MAG: VOC family protein [Candidatus Lokiarchaeota archaeon]|nr:VOC family protein [Candidatus Lokiarchaeota archaeon]
MSEKSLEHIAIASNNEKDSDEFFVELLGLKKIRSFTVSTDLMEKFFGVSKAQKIVRYEKGSLSFEVFITDDKSKASDIFTHLCLLIDKQDEFVDKATSMGFEVIKVPRQNSDGYYLFIKDSFHNLYEIKEKK